jgi:hypothetical protein
MSGAARGSGAALRRPLHRRSARQEHVHRKGKAFGLSLRSGRHAACSTWREASLLGVKLRFTGVKLRFGASPTGRCSHARRPLWLAGSFRFEVVSRSAGGGRCASSVKIAPGGAFRKRRRRRTHITDLYVEEKPVGGPHFSRLDRPPGRGQPAGPAPFPQNFCHKRLRVSATTATNSGLSARADRLDPRSVKALKATAPVICR